MSRFSCRPPLMTSPCWCSDNYCYFSQLNWHCYSKTKGVSKQYEIERQTNAYFVVPGRPRVAIDYVLENDFHDALPPNIIDLSVHMSGYVPRLKRHQSEGGLQHYSLVSPF